MSAEAEKPVGGLDSQVEEAGQRLRAAAAAASKAEQRAEAEINALEADLERLRAESERDLEQLKLRYEEELQIERAAKERALAAAEERLGEIEAETEVAEQRIAAAEERAAKADRTIADESVRAREAAAGWLRDQIEQIRREAGRR
jgi:chromosome segregation ATPase